MDKIFIHELKVETIIGILPWERINKQIVLLNIEIATDISKAAHSEKIKDTLDYAQLAQRVTDFIANSQFQLLETLAEKIIEIIFQEFSTNWIQLQISKPIAIANAKQVGISIERNRKDKKI